MIVATEIVMASPSASTIDQAMRTAILDAARRPVAAELGKPVMFKVHSLAEHDGWAFLHADMEDRHGAPIDYRGTPKAAAAEKGFLSRKYAALLRKSGNGWQVVVASKFSQSVQPTRRSRRRSLRTCQRPCRKSKSCRPSAGNEWPGDAG